MGKKSDFLARLEDTIIDKLEKADLEAAGKFILEEGLYLALMADLFMISGRMRAFEDDGKTRPFLASQRLMIADVLIAMRKISQTIIPLVNIAPLDWASPFLSSWETALLTYEDVDGVVYMVALPRHMRMFMVLGLPAMLRIAVQLTRQLIQLAKP